MSHGWQGSVRELRHVLAWRRDRGSASEATLGDDTPSALREAVAARERQVIANAIRNQGETHGCGSRGTGNPLKEKIVKL